MTDVQIRVIGVGNRFRRDDGVGLVVAELVRNKIADAVDVRVLSGEGASIIEAFDGADLVFIIDAARSFALSPGAVVSLDPRRQRIPSDFLSYSSHAFSVAEAVEMARALGMLPPMLRVVAITASDFGSGDGLTEVVAEAGRHVAEHIVAVSRRLLQREAVRSQGASAR